MITPGLTTRHWQLVRARAYRDGHDHRTECRLDLSTWKEQDWAFYCSSHLNTDATSTDAYRNNYCSRDPDIRPMARPAEKAHTRQRPRYCRRKLWIRLLHATGVLHSFRPLAG